MLLLGVVTFSIAIPLCSNTVNAFHYTRLAVIIFIMSGLLTIEIINIGVEDISIYCSLVFQSDRTLFMEVLLFMVGSLCLITFHPRSDNKDIKNSLFTYSGTIIINKSNVADTFEERSREGGFMDFFEIGERGRDNSVGAVERVRINSKWG